MFLALLVSVVAAAATSFGGLLATHPRMSQRSWLSVSLSFAAGAMLFVSFVELLPHGLNLHQDGGADASLRLMVYSAFFIGMVIVALIDRYLPASLNPSEIEGREGELDNREKKLNKKLLRSGAIVAIVLALHNFPEGLSTFLATYENFTVGVTLALAIAIHNIPEGIAIAAPIYAATKSRRQALLWSTISGSMEIVGAMVGAMLVGVLLPAGLTGALLGLVAGMMVFIAIDELLPAAIRYQTGGHQVVYGVVAGMAVVAIGLMLAPGV